MSARRRRARRGGATTSAPSAGSRPGGAAGGGSSRGLAPQSQVRAAAARCRRMHESPFAPGSRRQGQQPAERARGPQEPSFRGCTDKRKRQGRSRSGSASTPPSGRRAPQRGAGGRQRRKRGDAKRGRRKPLRGDSRLGAEVTLPAFCATAEGWPGGVTRREEARPPRFLPGPTERGAGGAAPAARAAPRSRRAGGGRVAPWDGAPGLCRYPRRLLPSLSLSRSLSLSVLGAPP